MEDIATFVRQTTLRSNISGTQSGGPSPGGKRCCAPVPHGYWKITAFVGGLRLAGMTTPMTLDGAMNDTAFVAVAEQVLAPTLRPGDVVVMDDLLAHELAKAREAIERAAAIMPVECVNFFSAVGYDRDCEDNAPAQGCVVMPHWP